MNPVTTDESTLEQIGELSAHFIDRTPGRLDQPVAHLEGWSVRDLTAHVGAVYDYARRNVEAATTDPAPPGPTATPPDGDGLLDWFTGRRDALLATLSAAPPERQAWSHAGVQTAGWWRRRMLHETAVHSRDLLFALGEREPVDGDIAADGIEEYIDVSLQVSARRPDRTYPEASLHLHRTDGPGEWMFCRGSSENEVVVTHEHGKGDAAVRGPASELLLWIWGRPVVDIEVLGDETVAAEWQSLAP